MSSPTGLERHPQVGRDRHHQRGQLLVDEAVAGHRPRAPRSAGGDTPSTWTTVRQRRHEVSSSRWAVHGRVSAASSQLVVQVFACSLLVTTALKIIIGGRYACS
jgi:hypothetical protein